MTKLAEPEDKVKAKVMLDAARCLTDLNSNRILHQDIKPDNVRVFSLEQVFAVTGS